MARIKAKAFNAEGQEIDVELDGATYLTRDQHQLQLEDTIANRLGRQARSLRAELLKDDEFKTEVLKVHGIDPNAKPGKGGATPEEIERLQTELRTREVTPLTERLTATEQRAEKLVASRRKAELTSALIEAGVKKQIAARFAELHAGEFHYDEKTDSFALKNGEDFVFSGKATKDKPYKGFSEFAEEFVSDKGNGDFVEKTTQHGPNLGNTPGSKGGVITISKADAMYADKWDAAQKQATDIGGTVQIVAG